MPYRFSRSLLLLLLGLVMTLSACQNASLVCTDCGAANATQAAFCSVCGASLANTSEGVTTDSEAESQTGPGGTVTPPQSIHKEKEYP